MRFSSKIRSLLFLMLILALASPIELIAGEWCCDDPDGVLIGKTDPKISCHNMGRWTKEPTKEDYFLCALGDISHSYCSAS